MTRGSKRVRLLLVAGALLMTTAFVAFAMGLNRQALWQVVRACVADFKLTTAPYPCLAVNLSGGEERGYVVLRPPLMHDLILSPTRQIVGIDAQVLRLPNAPAYFDAAWRARSFLADAGGRPPNRDSVALVVNSAAERTQDQLHIHIGCLLPTVQRAIAATAPRVQIAVPAPPARRSRIVRLGAITVLVPVGWRLPCWPLRIRHPVSCAATALNLDLRLGRRVLRGIA